MKERIKELRKKLNLNQTDFGKKIGVKQTTIAGYETGSKKPLDSIINSICREFNVNERWLKTGEGEMFIPADMQFMYDIGKLANDKNEFKKFLFQLAMKLPDETWDWLYNEFKKFENEQKNREY